MNELLQVLGDYLGELILAVAFGIIRRLELPMIRKKIEKRLRAELADEETQDACTKKYCTCGKNKPVN